MVPSVSAGIAFPVVLVACLVPLGGFLSVALGGRAARVDGWLRLGLWVALGLSTWAAASEPLIEALSPLGIEFRGDHDEEGGLLFVLEDAPGRLSRSS